MRFGISAALFASNKSIALFRGLPGGRSHRRIRGGGGERRGFRRAGRAGLRAGARTGAH